MKNPLVKVRTHKLADGTERSFITNMHERDLKTAMGIAEKKDWPVDGMDGRSINGVFVFVSPRTSGKRRPHRAMCKCSVEGCGKYMSAGRLHQHIKIHPDYLLVTPDGLVPVNVQPRRYTPNTLRRK